MAVTVDSFVNKYKLTITDFNAVELQAYITRYEQISLVELFGVELYDLYVSGVGISDPIYTALRDPFIEQLDSGTILNSRGVDDMITGIVYFYWSRDIETQRSSQGSVKKKAENSESATQWKSNLQSRWNEAINTYCAIQDYVLDNDDLYPEFEGLRKTILPII
jgi:hypothetical protein